MRYILNINSCVTEYHKISHILSYYTVSCRCLHLNLFVKFPIPVILILPGSGVPRSQRLLQIF